MNHWTVQLEIQTLFISSSAYSLNKQSSSIDDSSSKRLRDHICSTISITDKEGWERKTLSSRLVFVLIYLKDFVFRICAQNHEINSTRKHTTRLIEVQQISISFYHPTDELPDLRQRPEQRSVPASFEWSHNSRTLSPRSSYWTNRIDMPSSPFAHFDFVRRLSKQCTEHCSTAFRYAPLQCKESSHQHRSIEWIPTDNLDTW